MSCTLCKLSCNNCFALRAWSAKETKSPSYFFFVPFRWHYQFYSFQIIKEYKSGAVTRACALRLASFETIFFYLRTGLTERGLSAFCTGNFTLPLATISSSSSSARTKEEQTVKFLTTVKQHENTSILFSRLFSKNRHPGILQCNFPAPPPPKKKVSTLISVEGGYVKLSPDR